MGRQNARELHAIALTERILRSLKFPEDRITPLVEFDYVLRECSTSSVKVEMIDRKLYGQAIIRYSGLALWQDPENFYKEVIPHEIAHIMDSLTQFKKGMEPEGGHGLAWAEWVSRIDSSLLAGPAPTGQYDFRAVALQKGGIATKCECEGLEGIKVVSSNQRSRKKLSEGQDFCKYCDSAWVAISLRDLPDDLLIQVKYIQEAISLSFTADSGKDE